MPVLATTCFPTGSEIFSLVRSILNDADIPGNFPITPTGGASRTGTTTTITTSVAHGLQVGNIVQVQSVSDTSFNGTQTVLTVPSSTTFTYVQPSLPNASSGNGVVSIVIQGDVFTDQVLLNFANKAYRKVQGRLLASGSKSMTSETYFTIPANATQILDTTNPQLPVDFLAPRDLAERISTSGLSYSPMQVVNVLPSFPTSVTLARNGLYAWYEDGIYLPGCVNAMDMRLRYFVAFPDISGADGVFTIRGCQDSIASKTAELAAASRGATALSYLQGMFEDDLKDLLNLQVHARNYLPGRRKPNNFSRNSGGYWGSRIL